MLLWRVASDVLPTRSKLQRLNSGIPLECPLCQSLEENVVHLFVECSFAWAIWFGFSGGSLWRGLVPANGKELVSFILDPPIFLVPSSHSSSFFWALQGVIFLELVWKARNNLCFAGISPDPMETVRGCVAHVEEFEQLLVNPSPSNINLQVRSLLGWTSPKVGSIKFNSNAGCRPSFSALGEVTKNVDGSMIGIWCTHIRAVYALLREALAAKFAVEIASSLSCDNPFFEGDAKVVIDSLTSSSCAGWEVSIKAAVQDFHSFSFVWIRTGNVATPSPLCLGFICV